MTGKAFWYGKEVEGRFTGLPTCFVRSIVPADAFKFGHIYFTWEAVNGVLKQRTNLYYDLRRYIEQGGMVSIEVTEATLDKIPLDIANRAHLLLRIKSPAAGKLKVTDTIALDISPFNVMLGTVMNLQRTAPHVYAEDTEKNIFKAK